MTAPSRIKAFRTVASVDLLRNPANFRRHPPAQRAALRGLLASVGRVAPLLAYEDSTGALVCLDGHARLDEADTWDVAVLDLTEDEAALVLATLDRLGAQAEIDPDALMALLDTLDPDARQTAQAAWSDAELARLLGAPPVTPDELWQGMPDFVQDDQESWKAIKVHFDSQRDYDAFARLVEQTLTPQTKYIWYPYKPKEDLTRYRVEDES